jgi:hypothetical protein
VVVPRGGGGGPRPPDAPVPPWAAAVNVAIPVLFVVAAVTAWLGSRKAPVL